MKAQTEAMRALAYSASAALDKARHHPDDGERRRNQALVDFLIPVVKGWCTEQCVEIASTGVQIHGGMGFVEETGAAQYLRDARITTIYEGTTGIQASDLVGRKVAFEKGATAFALIDEMRRLDGDLARSRNADVAAARAPLKQAVDSAAAATQWLLDTFPANPNAVAAVSVPYLKLWGTVFGGWLMARAALIADAKLGADGDVDFYRTKIATARFYAEHVLPVAATLASEVLNGAQSVLALTEAQF
jgi:acyl-CoA dehydrogenase